MTDELSLEEAKKLLEDDDELSLEEVEALLASEDTPRRRRTKKSSLYEDRTLQNWLKVDHFGHREDNTPTACEVELHDESRPREKGMCTRIDDKYVCRICFLNELDKLDGES